MIKVGLCAHIVCNIIARIVLIHIIKNQTLTFFFNCNRIHNFSTVINLKSFFKTLIIYILISEIQLLVN